MNTFVTSDTISLLWLFWFWKWYTNHFKRKSSRTASGQPGISRPIQSSLKVRDRFGNRGDHDSKTQPQSELKVRLTNQHIIHGEIVCQGFKSLRVIKIYSILFTLQLFAGSYTCLIWWFFKLTWRVYLQVITCQVIWRGVRGQGDKLTSQLVKLNLSSWQFCPIVLVTASEICH